MNQLTITYNDETTLKCVDVDHFDFVGEYLIVTYADLKNRSVHPLSEIDSYEYKGQPVVTNTPPKTKSKSSKKK